MEPHTGYVRAMVGSYDFQQSRFNRATQARRQAGSSFKPFVYATALEAGLTQLSPVVDAPISFTVAGGRVWTPRNYGNKYYGNVTLRTALTRSLNTVSVKLVNQYGVSNVIQLARRLGIKSDIPSNLSLALGSASVTPLEMTSAFASLASNGEPIAPRFIKRVTDDEGKVIFEANPPEAPDPGDNDAYGLLPAKSARPALTPATAYVLSDMMRSVVESGTAQRVKALGRPAAGKTGTTNNYIDAWFIGYTPELVTGVWVGVDNRNTLGDGETGGKSAAPIWLGFMEKALHDAPIKPFEAPPGIVFLKADPLTGNRAGGPGVPYLPFRLETLPAGLMGQRSSGIDPADTW
jgi:penicillin-binding protein 1A